VPRSRFDRGWNERKNRRVFDPCNAEVAARRNDGYAGVRCRYRNFVVHRVDFVHMIAVGVPTSGPGSTMMPTARMPRMMATVVRRRVRLQVARKSCAQRAQESQAHLHPPGFDAV
jgi:hypothetical protein